MRNEDLRPTPTYDAFISYNSADLDVVQALAERLHERGFQVFLDHWRLVPGETWQEALIEALDSTPCCLVMCGPHGFGPWQSEEVHAAVERRVRGETMRVVPVLLPGSADSAWRSVPFLGRFAACDYRQRSDQNRARAFEGIVAGIRGEAPGPPAPAVVPKEPAQALFRSRFNVMAGTWRRTSVVEAAREAVASGGSPLVLYGLPGIGKTSALCDVADGYRSDRTVLALPVGGTAAAEPRYLVDEVNTWLATAFGKGLAAEDLLGHQWPDGLGLLLRQVADERLLVLLDDLDPGPFADTVLRVFAAFPETLVLATARGHLGLGQEAGQVAVPPMSRGESVEFIAHLVKSMNLPVDPEDIADRLPDDVLSHPLALRTFLTHTRFVPTPLLVGPGLPADVLSARTLVATVVDQLPTAHRAALAHAVVLDQVPLADLLGAGVALPPGFTPALQDLAGRCLVSHAGGGIEVPRLVAEALDIVDPSARRAALSDVTAQLRQAVGEADDTALASMARALPPVALMLVSAGHWRELRETVPPGFLDRLNAGGFWKEYVLLARALISAADHLREDTAGVHLRIRVSRKMGQLGDTRTAWDLVREAEAVTSTLDSRSLNGDLAGLRAFLAYLQGDDKSTLRELKSCVELRTQDGDAGGLLIAHKLEGNVHLRRGKYKNAAAAYGAALAAGGGEADPRHRMDAETSLAICEFRQGNREASALRLERLVREMRALPVHSDLPRALHALALVYESQGFAARALEVARQAALAQANDPAVRAAVDRLVWRLVNLGAGPRPQAGRADS
ncbi:toll/interleukin-1 receptor domain-containing protein [Streptomyces cyaneofuscatus]|uniref:toll/interleukin-1 receptor domain-containing protein n=1 Tax=Streptomyces cyaneofuscatus TaxID=66883 RepID=UPI003429296E